MNFYSKNKMEPYIPSINERGFTAITHKKTPPAPLSEKWLDYIKRAQEYTYEKIREIEKREIDKTYSEYYALGDYQRKCLGTTNYWRVMQGQKFIDVPETDIEFWKTFYPRAFELAAGWQEGERRLKEYNIIDTERRRKLKEEKALADAAEVERKANEPVVIQETNKKEKRATKAKITSTNDSQPSLF